MSPESFKAHHNAVQIRAGQENPITKWYSLFRFLPVSGYALFAYVPRRTNHRRDAREFGSKVQGESCSNGLVKGQLAKDHHNTCVDHQERVNRNSFSEVVLLLCYSFSQRLHSTTSLKKKARPVLPTQNSFGYRYQQYSSKLLYHEGRAVPSMSKAALLLSTRTPNVQSTRKSSLTSRVAECGRSKLVGTDTRTEGNGRLD